jgi:hypothetical protein
MPAKFDDLSEQQKADFWATVTKWGLTPADVHPEIDTSQIGPQTFISGSDPGSQVKTKPFTITSVQHMKSLVGIPDESFTSGRMRDRTVNYPQALPDHRTQLLVQAPNNCWLKDRLTEDELEDVSNSWLAYLVGNSKKISAPMVDMINAVHFPAVGAVAAVENINVASGTTHTFGTPGAPMHTIVIGTLTIQPGGAIAFASPCTLEVQQTNVAAAPTRLTMAMSENPMAAAAENNIQIYAPAPTPPAQPPPQPPKPQAGNAYGGVADKSCTTASSAATDGATGTTGSPGTNGSKAMSPPPVIAYLGVVTGTYNFLAGGGNGQDGGQGGQGGAGGQGGDGVAGAKGARGGACSNQGPGKGGQGGTGGPGGKPGDGANGSTSYFYFTSTVQPFAYNIKPVGGFGGQPGGGGQWGVGGAGGADPAGVMPQPYIPANYTNGPGVNGATGNNGNPGSNAQPGILYFQQKS